MTFKMPVTIFTNSVAMATVLLTLKWVIKPSGEAGWVIKKPLLEAHPMGALVSSIYYLWNREIIIYYPSYSELKHKLLNLQKWSEYKKRAVLNPNGQ
eukprot:sb/3478974/